MAAEMPVFSATDSVPAMTAALDEAGCIVVREMFDSAGREQSKSELDPRLSCTDPFRSRRAIVFVPNEEQCLADQKRATETEFDVIVVGAGLAGLYMLHRLRGLGLSARVLERGSGVGGTWFWNRYPGARCDIQSVEYSYQFSEELQADWEWTGSNPFSRTV
jgi:hypothetical protein